jgi:hypothetical protein
MGGGVVEPDETGSAEGEIEAETAKKIEAVTKQTLLALSMRV